MSFPAPRPGKPLRLVRFACRIAISAGLVITGASCAGTAPTAPTPLASVTGPETLPTTSASPAATVTTTIGGVVRDGQSNTPIAVVTVEIIDPAIDRGLVTTTGDDGSYRLTGIQSQTFTVQFSHPNYQTFSFEYTFRAGTERTDLSTRLTPGPPVPGEPSFAFDEGVSVMDQDLIRQGIELGQSYFPPAVGRGVIGATTIRATLSPSTRTGTTAVANGHSIDVYINSQGWQTSTAIRKIKIIVHEYFHVLQNETNWPGFSNTQGPRWLLEGAAEYVGYRAVIDSRLVAYDTVRNCQISNVLMGTPLPPLSTLEGQAFNETQGATYALAWLGTEQATQRNLGRLSLFWAPGSSWQSVFSTAFGVAVDQFYAAFESGRRDYRASGNACNF